MPTMTATAIPVASDHSNPFPAILVTAHTAMMGAFRIIIKPIVISIWTCVISFVERVIRLSVEKRLISSIEKDSTLRNSWPRRCLEKPAARIAAKYPTITADIRLPSVHSSIMPPASQMALISLPGVCVSRVIWDM